MSPSRVTTPLIDLSAIGSWAETYAELKRIFEGKQNFWGDGPLLIRLSNELGLVAREAKELKTLLDRCQLNVQQLQTDHERTQRTLLKLGLPVARVNGDQLSAETIDSGALSGELAPAGGRVSWLPTKEKPHAAPAPLQANSTVSSQIPLPAWAGDTLWVGFNLAGGAVLRSGQELSYPGHIVFHGDTHTGSRLLAGGCILVCGCLGGAAFAGHRQSAHELLGELRLVLWRIGPAAQVAIGCHTASLEGLNSNQLPLTIQLNGEQLVWG